MDLTKNKMTAQEYIKKHIGNVHIDEVFTREELAEMFLEFAKIHIEKKQLEFTEQEVLNFTDYATSFSDEDGELLNPNYLEDKKIFVSTKELLEIWKINNYVKQCN
jgi:hypothetical protein